MENGFLLLEICNPLVPNCLRVFYIFSGNCPMTELANGFYELRAIIALCWLDPSGIEIFSRLHSIIKFWFTHPRVVARERAIRFGLCMAQ